MERRQGKLTGHQAADCIVTISKMDGVECSRSITEVSAPAGESYSYLIIRVTWTFGNVHFP